MRRWVKWPLIALGVLVVLLVLNAVTVSNETADAERNVEGAELIDTNSGTLQALDEGNPVGDPIVMIHGYTASMRWFDELAALLRKDYRVVRVDLLGHGGSDKPGGGNYSIETQAQAIAEALASLDVKGATVVGHSLGGTIATGVAEQSPGLVSRVVNIDQATDDSYEDLSLSAELGYTPVIGQAFKRLTDVAPTSVVRGEFQQAFAPDFNIASGFENPDQVVDDLGEMTYTAYDQVADEEGSYSGERPLDDRLASLGIPVLVIFGSEDQIYDAEAAIEPYGDIPGVQVELLEGVGHSPQIEDPETVYGLIRAFVEMPTPAEQAAAKARAKRKAQKAKAAGQAAKKPAKKPAGAAANP